MLVEVPRASDSKLIGRTPAARAIRSDRIVRVAMELAAEGGYDAVQMREVARRANVSLSTLYRYYTSKEDLIMDVVTSEMESLRVDLVRRPPRQRSPEGRAGEAFVRAFRAMILRPGFAHTAMSASRSPSAFLPDRDLVPDRGMSPHSFVNIAAETAWGSDHSPIAAEYRALHMIETIWVGSTISWLNGELSANEVEKRLRLAARNLLC